MAYCDQLLHFCLPLWLFVTLSSWIILKNTPTPRHVRRVIQTNRDVLHSVVKVQPSFLFFPHYICPYSHSNFLTLKSETVGSSGTPQLDAQFWDTFLCKLNFVASSKWPLWLLSCAHPSSFGYLLSIHCGRYCTI